MQVESRHTQQNGQLLSLLREAEAYVGEGRTPNQCPVCEQNVDAVGLAQRLRERIGAMQELASIISTTGAAQSLLGTKRAFANQARNDFCQKISRLTGLLKACSLAEIEALKLDWACFAGLLDSTQPAGALEQRARFWEAIAASRSALEARRAADQKSIHQHNAIAGYVDTLREKKAQGIFQQKLLDNLRAALEIVMQQRKDYVEGILASISTEVQTLYSKLHPDEAIGGVRFFLKPNAIGSLEFDAQFQDVVHLPPQAYYSESHLDTLGICVFLALAKHFKTDNTLIVFDDVLTSVDEVHLERMIELIADEASEFGQMIITTHSRAWYDRVRMAKGASVHLLEPLQLGHDRGHPTQPQPNGSRGVAGARGSTTPGSPSGRIEGGYPTRTVAGSAYTALSLPSSAQGRGGIYPGGVGGRC